MNPAPAPRAPRLRIIVALAALIAFVVLAWTLPVGEWTLELAGRIRGAGAAGVLVFVAIYVAAEVALVPGSLLTMAAGFAYGPFLGVLIASPASVLAATTAFLLGRTALRGWIQRQIAGSARSRALDRAVARNSFKLILLLRLSPVIPFNVLNYVLGLSDATLGRYVLASFIGMLPGTWLYVYLGSLATTAAALTDVKAGARTHVVLLVAGLAATVAAVFFVTKAARRALADELDGDAA